MGLTRPRLGQITTTTSSFDDPIVVLNAAADGTNTTDIGIVFERGDDQNKVLIWDESADEFVLANSTETGGTNGNVIIASYADLQIGSLTASNISSITVNNAYTLPTIDGNAGYVLTTNGSGTVSWAVGGGEASGHEIQNAGVALTTRTGLNFDGTYLVATDDAGNDRNNVTLSLSSVGQDIVPSVDNTYSLGSATKMWQDVYIGPGSLYLNGKKVLEETAGTMTFTADANQNISLAATGTGDIEIVTGASGTIEINGTLQIAAGKNITSSDGNAISITDSINMNSNSINMGTNTITDTKVGQWDTAYGWGNHASSGYLTGNQTITLTGDASGSGTTSIAVTVANDSHNHSSSSGAFTVGGDLTVSGGDIVLSGTGRIQGIDTVSAGTDAASKTYVDTAVANVVDSAPAALDTLNELAAALGDDANFSTTVTTSIGEKLAKASNLSDLTNAATARTNLGLGSAATTASTAYATAAQGATADAALPSASYTASDILTKIKTVDGSGSGLDADTVDGIQASSFVRSDANDTKTGSLEINNGTSQPLKLTTSSSGPWALELYRSDTAFSSKVYNNGSQWYFQHNPSIAGSTNWHSGNDGSGSGLDADTVDGIHASSFLQGNQTITLSGDVSGSGTTSISCTVANDSHTHSFNNLTSKTSGTGDYKTTGDFITAGGTASAVKVGDGSGSMSLTTNDGYGNANVCFNHVNGVPDTSGNSGRIECNVDSTSGAAMYFELKSGTTSGSAVGLNTIMTLSESAITAGSGIVFSGTATSARYADLAEKYMPDAEYTAGTVLQFGGEAEVTLADEYATRKVAGVVSTNPAFMMNEQLDGGVYIALSGRVPCRAMGIVHPGDLMVASNTPGVAVAWDDPLRDPPAGSIIGKAIKGKALAAEELIEVVVGVR